MPPKKDKAAPVEVPVVPVEKKDDIGQLLLKKYQAQRHTQQSDLFEFTHGKYEEWMDFFGFNLESEFRWRNEEKKQQQKHTSTRGGGGRSVGAVGSIRSKTMAARDGVTISEPAAVLSATMATSMSASIIGAPAVVGAEAIAAAPTLTQANVSSKDAIDPVKSCPVADDAGVLSPELQERFLQVDKVALEVGACPTTATWEEVAKLLGEPYARATYLQSTAQCAHFKSRAVFRWLCEHMKLTPPVPSNTPETPKAGGVQVGSLTLPIPDAALAGGKGGKGAKGGKPPTGGAQGGKGGSISATQAAVPTAEPISDSKRSEAAFASRSGDAETLSILYASMLTLLGVECVPVKGTLKGLLDHLGKHVGALSWGWNVISIPVEADTEEEVDITTLALTKQEEKRHQRSFDYGTSQRIAQGRVRFLVDVSLAMAYVGARAGVVPPKDFPGATPGTTAGGKEAPAVAGKKDTTTPRKPGGGAVVPDAIHPAVIEHVKVDCMGFSQPADYSPHFEPFYFYTSPHQFAPLHNPENSAHQVFAKPLGRTHWEIYPRLSHDFYKLDLELGSHKRRSWLTVKRTPFYLSFTLNNTRSTDLVLNVFKGAAPSIDETSKPIDSKFIWSQREEMKGSQTFSIMLPDVGLYTLAVGARHVDENTEWGVGVSATTTRPNSSPGGVPSPVSAGANQANNSVGGAEGTSTSALNPNLSGDYRFVTAYQTVVNFVPANETMYPRQLVTPALAKLVGPISHKCVAGANTISVVPTNPRVHAVAVVNKVYKQQVLKTNQAGGGSKLISEVNSEVGGTSIGYAPPIPSYPSTPGDGSKRTAGATGSKKKGAVVDDAALKPKLPVVEEPVIERTELHLLSLNTDKGVFEGTISLKLGLVEMWLLLDKTQQEDISSSSSGGSPHPSSSKKGSGRKAGTANRAEGFQTNLADPAALYQRYMTPSAIYKGPVGAEAAVMLGLKDPRLSASGIDVAAGGVSDNKMGDNRSEAGGAIAPTSVVPSVDVEAVAADEAVQNAKGMAHLGTFIPFITEMQVVKRIPAKELNVNEGEPLIQPFMLDWESDRPYVLRLLAKTSLDGRNWEPKPLKAGFLSKELHQVGGYFQQGRPGQIPGGAANKSIRKPPVGADDEEEGGDGYYD